ncbi:BREX system P-loop protein BrxC [Ktedonobacter robiniae]|uniref:BREX system P-loop protein BrxC n=1 Tax=Ktedonobacter robiniae TaxID=2778365 RepID=A0ABQ3V2R3_9CHLR|nr:BREX system P-loop protein BrxC [Ktedonobacter robiniae]GHO59273.1 hypothetical protein KSB_77480 [Ktedonobacter robiniae]
MKIREMFGTKIQERIQPVVKVSDRTPAVLLDELQNLVVTPQWERYLHLMLQEFIDAFDSEDEQEIGFWINGFFGSGKSLLMKILGALLEGGELDGQSVHEIFLGRILTSSSEIRDDFKRFLKICQTRIACQAIGGNIHTQQAGSHEPLTILAFRLFAQAQGYTHLWPFAWAVEAQIDARGLTEEFHAVASSLCKQEWSEIAEDAEFYSARLYQAAAQVLPDHFNSPDQVKLAVESAKSNGITPVMFVERLCRWCREHDRGMKRQKLLLQFDELGQWLQGSNINARIMEVQALVEAASELGQGRIWIAVTAHGDIQSLQQNVQQEYYAKILQRFIAKCKLSNEDINAVVQERLLRKTGPATSFLRTCFQQQSSTIYDLGTLKDAPRTYPLPDEETFAQFYPYLPWTVTIIPDITRGIALATGRGAELTGSNRNMIGVVQLGILNAKGLLEEEVGRLISLADLYYQFDTDIAVETRNDLRRVGDRVPGANKELIERTARALYLLGQVEVIPCTVENLTRALVTSIDEDLTILRSQIKGALDQLVRAGYAKQVGESYAFLSTQQRSFQEKVQNKQEEWLARIGDLILKLDDYKGDDALRFDQITLPGMGGRQKTLRLVLDNRVLRNPTEHVTIHVYSPLQRLIAPEIGNDVDLKQQSIQQKNTFFLRMEFLAGFQRALALAVATEEVAEHILHTGQGGEAEFEVAKLAKKYDIPEYKREVRYLFEQAMRNSQIFFRGSIYYPSNGDNAGAMVRSTLGPRLLEIYSAYADLPHRLHDDAKAVRDALNHVVSNKDLEALGVFKADGTLNEGNPLLSRLRSRIPLEKEDLGFVYADQLRQDLERPPYGWDGNSVKVGLALLLRAGACKLFENGTTYTNPGDPSVLLCLTKAQRFKTVRVQGVRTEISMQDLIEIRKCMDDVFGIKPQLILAVMDEKLKEQLQILHIQAEEVEAWANPAGCALPLSFETGHTLVGELLVSNVPNIRLPQFIQEHERLWEYKALLGALLRFKDEHGSLYQEERDFYNRMYHLENPPAAILAFLQGWREATQQRSITTQTRWHELTEQYRQARQALTDEIERLRQEGQQDLARQDDELLERVEQASIPAEVIEATLADLRASLDPERAKLAQASLSISEARSVKSALVNRRVEIGRKLREISQRYQTTSTPEVEDSPAPSVVHISWQSLLGERCISSPAELQQVVDTLQRLVYNELEQRRIVILE